MIEKKKGGLRIHRDRGCKQKKTAEQSAGTIQPGYHKNQEMTGVCDHNRRRVKKLGGKKRKPVGVPRWEKVNN